MVFAKALLMLVRCLAILGVFVIASLCHSQHAQGPLPPGALLRLGQTGFQSPYAARCFAVSFDGKRIAHGASEGLYVRNAQTMETDTSFSTPGFLARALAWSRSGKLLAAVNGSIQFSIWNVQTGQKHWPGKLRQSDRSHLKALSFIAQDSLLALVYKDWRVELWDVAKGELSHSWVLDFKKRSVLKSLGPDHEIRWVALSPLGERMAWLAAAPAGKAGASSVLLYNTETGELLRELKELPAAGRVDLPDDGQTLVLYPPGLSMVSKLTPAACSVVDVAKGKVRCQVVHRATPPVYVEVPYISSPEYVSLAKSAVLFDTSLLMIDEVGLTRWDAKTGKQLEKWDHACSHVAVSGNGQRLVVGQGE